MTTFCLPDLQSERALEEQITDGRDIFLREPEMGCGGCLLPMQYAFWSMHPSGDIAGLKALLTGEHWKISTSTPAIHHIAVRIARTMQPRFMNLVGKSPATC